MIPAIQVLLECANFGEIMRNQDNSLDIAGGGREAASLGGGGRGIAAGPGADEVDAHHGGSREEVGVARALADHGEVLGHVSRQGEGVIGHQGVVHVRHREVGCVSHHVDVGGAGPC